MSESDYLIRPATIDDARGIATVGVKSWKETYTGIVDQQFLDAINLEQRVANAEKGLAEAEDETSSFVAIYRRNKEVVGLANIGRNRIKDLPYDAELFSIYLLKLHQGKQIGRQLAEACFKAARRLGFRSLVVQVLKANNTRKFYEHLGAQLIDEKMTTVGDREYPELIYAWDAIPDVKDPRA